MSTPNDQLTNLSNNAASNCPIPSALLSSVPPSNLPSGSLLNAPPAEEDRKQAAEAEAAPTSSIENTELYSAIKQRDYRACRVLIENGKVNKDVKYEGKTLLEFIFKQYQKGDFLNATPGLEELLDVLLDQNSELPEVTITRSTFDNSGNETKFGVTNPGIAYVIECRDIKFIQLLARKIDINKGFSCVYPISIYGFNALSYAIIFGDEEDEDFDPIINVLLNASNEDAKQLALHSAVEHRKLDSLKKLIEKTKNSIPWTNEIRSPLEEAIATAESDEDEYLTLLIDNKRFISHKNPNNGQTALMTAMLKSKKLPKTVLRLIRKVSDYHLRDVVDGHKNTHLHYASAHSNTEILSTIISRITRIGCDSSQLSNLVNGEGETLLATAFNRQNLDTAIFLIPKLASIYPAGGRDQCNILSHFIGSIIGTNEALKTSKPDHVIVGKMNYFKKLVEILCLLLEQGILYEHGEILNMDYEFFRTFSEAMQEFGEEEGTEKWEIYSLLYPEENYWSKFIGAAENTAHFFERLV